MSAEGVISSQLKDFADLLFEASQQLSLTAIDDRAGIECHLIDQSAVLASYLPTACRSLMDVGTGGGIPGIPIAILHPDIDVHLLDARATKIAFLDSVVDALGLENVTTVHDRAESLAHIPAYREQFDVVTARAVARLATLVELVMPFLRIGGRAMLPKGNAVSDEIDEAVPAVEMLGGKAGRVICDDRLIGQIIVIEKIVPTPTRYPRRPGLPGKRPFGVTSR